MGLIYEKVYMSSVNIDAQNCGLKRILITIGENEFQKKWSRACRDGKTSFVFPSGRNEEKKICSVNAMPVIKESLYYAEGIECINKKARMHKMNKRALRRLVNAEVAQVSESDGYHYVYYIHKWKSARIFAAIRQYIKKEFSNKKSHNTGFANTKKMLEYVRICEKGFFGSEKLRGEKIIAKPYIDELRENGFLFSGKIVNEIEGFNKITGKEGV